MTKNSKHKLLFTTLLLTVLLVTSAYSTMVPNASAAEVTSQEKGLAVLNDAVGFDLEKYATTSREYPPESFMGVVQSENVGYTLESDASKVKLDCTFTNGALHILQVLEREGTPVLTKSIDNARDMAEDFLSNYQLLSDNPFYGELSAMLSNVDDAKNSTRVLGNTKFEVTASGNRKSYVWSYTFNDIEAARKCVALTYKNGFLKSFVDTWDLYKVGSTKVNLSEEDAVAIAMEQAKAFSWKIVDGNDTIEINNFEVTEAMVKHLVFCNSINADNERGEDRLMLYPMWRIGVELDKYYPGDVYGIYVDIWADTGEIRNVQEAVSEILPFGSEIATIEESTGKQLNGQTLADGAIQGLPSTTWMALLSSAGVLVFGSIWITKKKKMPKRYYKITGVLLCSLIAAAILPISISTVNATEFIYRATVWGSEAEPKTTEELDKQEDICFYINNQFTWSSYDSINYQGPETTKQNLYSSLADESDYPSSAIVWFDHGPGTKLDFGGHPQEWHFMLCDSNTDPDLDEGDPNGYIYDFEILGQTIGKTHFAFISVCGSAQRDLINHNNPPALLGNGTYGDDYGNAFPIGMAFAWADGVYLDTTGYDSPDTNSPYCYIGFHWGSAALNQEVDPYGYLGVLYYDWVFSFFGRVLNHDISVNDALDYASNLHFAPQDFGDTDLHTGFTAHWEGCADPEEDSCRMEVYGNGAMHLQYPMDVRAYDDHDSYVHSKVTVDGYSYGSTYGWVRAPPGTHLIGVEDNPDPWRTFTHFDGYGTDQNPISVNVNSRPTITAYYDALEFQHNFVQSIYGYGWYGYMAGADYRENLIGSSNDGQYAYLYAGYYGDTAWISGQTYMQATGHIELYGYSAPGYSSHLAVSVSNDGSNYDPVSEQYISQSSPGWIDCGTYAGSFGYIKIHVDADSGPSGIAIDSVRVHTPTNYTLTVSSSGGGYTDPVGNIDYPDHTYAQVEAYEALGWELDHWLLDSETAGSDPSIDVYMDDDHLLQAVFTPLPSYYWVSSIYDYDGPVSSPGNLVGSQTDGQFAGLEGWGPYQYYGWIKANMNTQATGHVYMYGACAAGYPGHLYVYVSSDNNNWDLVSTPYVSQTSPYWIDCGTYQSSFNYIKVTVEDPQEWVGIGIDAVCVEP